MDKNIPKKMGNLRYAFQVFFFPLPSIYVGIVNLLFYSGATICYTLRVNMSVAVKAMADELGWTSAQKGLILSSFYWG